MQLPHKSSQTQTIVLSRSLCCNLLQQQMIYICIIQVTTVTIIRFWNHEAQVSRFKNIYAYVHQQKRHFSLLKHKYLIDFKAKNNTADKESDVLKQKNVTVAKLHMKNELTAYSWSQQMIRVSMSSVLKLSPVLKQASEQKANHKFDCILAKWSKKIINL